MSETLLLAATASPLDLGAAAIPPVVVIDDGELGDVCDLLAEIGADPLRLCRPGDLSAWLPPRDLLVTTGRRALALRLPLRWESGGPTTIAVVEEDSRTLRTLLTRAGFQYLVRRPVDPRALRLLLMRGVFRGREARRAPRFPFGYEVICRIGWRRRKATLLDISPEGCRLMGPLPFEPGASISIRIPPEAAGGRALRLRGHVLRCNLVSSGVGGRGFSCAVMLDPPGARTGKRLAALLAERSIGPARLTQEPGSRGERAPRAEPEAALPPTEPAPADEEPANGDTAAPPLQADVAIELPASFDPAPLAEEAEEEQSLEEVPLLAEQEAKPQLPAFSDSFPAEQMERRQHRRGAFHQEVVALGEQAERVIEVFVGSDLSEGGVRVEPHPALSAGDRMRLAIYDASCREPVIIGAEVIHDDGKRGLGLRFTDVDRAAVRQLGRIASTLPAVEAIHPAAPANTAVVLAELLPPDPDEKEDGDPPSVV